MSALGCRRGRSTRWRRPVGAERAYTASAESCVNSTQQRTFLPSSHRRSALTAAMVQANARGKAWRMRMGELYIVRTADQMKE